MSSICILRVGMGVGGVCLDRNKALTDASTFVPYYSHSSSDSNNLEVAIRYLHEKSISGFKQPSLHYNFVFNNYLENIGL